MRPSIITTKSRKQLNHHNFYLFEQTVLFVNVQFYQIIVVLKGYEWLKFFNQIQRNG